MTNYIFTWTKQLNIDEHETNTRREGFVFRLPGLCSTLGSTQKAPSIIDTLY